MPSKPTVSAPIRRGAQLSLALLTALIFGLVPAGSDTARAQVSEQLCLIDYGFTTNDCTSNDVDIALVAVDLPVVSDCLAAPFGVASAEFITEVYSQGGNNRYDVAVWISKNGIDPRVPGSECHHEYFHPNSGTPNPTNPAGTGPFRELESGGRADVCGDATNEQAGNNTIVDAIFKAQPVDIQCVDADDDGEVDYLGCVSWDNNSESDTCDSVSEALPGTSAKCRCTSFDTGLTMPPRIELTKTTVSQTLVGQTGGQYTYDVVYRVRVQNTGLQDIVGIDVFDDLSATFAGATSWSLTSMQLLAGQSDFSEGGSITANPGYTGAPPNHNLVNTGATRRLNYDDTLPVSDQGDFATFEIEARFTTPCAANYVNTSSVEGSSFFTSESVGDSDSSEVGCTPTAVGAFDLSAESGPGSSRLLAAIVATLGLCVLGMGRGLRAREDGR